MILLVTLYLAELVAYDPSIAGTVTLRYASGQGFVTGPAETPANTFYDARIKQPALMTREMFGSGTTFGASRVGFGDLILLNGDGELDGLIEYGFDGRAITIRRGEPGAAYPSGFTTVLVGTMQSVEVLPDAVTVKIRDRQREVQVPLQPNRYAGDNVLPDGLEGVADDLKGKPKPLTFGKVSNIPAVPVNTSKLIYQVHDGAINGIDAVYDRGIPLLVGFPFSKVVSTFQPNKDNVLCITWAETPGLYVVGGQNAALATSPDGTNWTARTSGFGANTDVNDVVYSETLGLFVIVGEDGEIATSPDGITWTQRTSNFGNLVDIEAVTWSEDVKQFVAVGGSASGEIATSSDGIGWTQRITGVEGDVSFAGVAYGNGLFVAVGGGGGAEPITNLTSPDGRVWSGADKPRIPSGVFLMQGLAFGQGTFVVVGSQGTATSPDGEEWILRSGVGEGRAVTYADGPGFFLLVGTTGKMMTSVDGEVWNKIESGFIRTLLTAHYGNQVLLAGATDGELGLAIPNGTYGSEADLLDDDLAPAAGNYKVWLNGGYFRLGIAPAGLITADVRGNSSGEDENDAFRHHFLFTQALTQAGLTSGDWSAADVTLLKAALAGQTGFWTDEDMSCEELLNIAAESAGAWWGVDRAGIFRIKQVKILHERPSFEITDNDLLEPLRRVLPNDPGQGLPVFRSKLRWGKVYAVQDTDLAGGVTAARRALVSKEWREAVSDDPDVQVHYLLAPEVIEESRFDSESDAQTEVNRRQVLRGTRRDHFEIVLSLDDDTKSLDIGDEILLTHPRYGLSGGKKFLILRLEPNPARERLGATLWGPMTPPDMVLAATLTGTGLVDIMGSGDSDVIPTMILAGQGTIT